jgi:hypothetical protein
LPSPQPSAIFGERNHLRAFVFMVAPMFAGFPVIPFIAPTPRWSSRLAARSACAYHGRPVRPASSRHRA